MCSEVMARYSWLSAAAGNSSPDCDIIVAHPGGGCDSEIVGIYFAEIYV